MIFDSKSVWELLYFVTNNTSNEPLDAREKPGINVTSLGTILSPAGIPYRILTPHGKYWRYKAQAFHIYLNNKIDMATEDKLEQALKTEIEGTSRCKYHLSFMLYNLDFLKQIMGLDIIGRVFYHFHYRDNFFKTLEERDLL